MSTYADQPAPNAVVERERRENLFRELEPARWGVGLVLLLLLLGLVALGLLLSGNVVLILVALLAIGLAVLLLVLRSRGSLERVPPTVAIDRAETAAWHCQQLAMERLRLDEEDVLQQLVLFGGAPRPPVEGRIRSVSGPKRQPFKRWVPAAPYPEVGEWCYGRYQIHVLFALKDYLAYYTRHFDFIEDCYVPAFHGSSTGELHSDYESNKLGYRHIENVRMTNWHMELQMTGGRTHRFTICIPGDMLQGPIANQGHDAAFVNARLRSDGEAFEHAVNQLRQEWEERQAAR